MDYKRKVNHFLFVCYQYILSNGKARKAWILKVRSFLHAPYCPEWTAMKLRIDQYEAIGGIGFNPNTSNGIYCSTDIFSVNHFLCNAML